MLTEISLNIYCFLHLFSKDRINLPSTGAGLRARKVCSLTSNTLCEPLDGYFCIDPIKDGCQEAVEHTKCSPGQYIKQSGKCIPQQCAVHQDHKEYQKTSVDKQHNKKKWYKGRNYFDNVCNIDILTFCIILFRGFSLIEICHDPKSMAE